VILNIRGHARSHRPRARTPPAPGSGSSPPPWRSRRGGIRLVKGSHIVFKLFARQPPMSSQCRPPVRDAFPGADFTLIGTPEMAHAASPAALARAPRDHLPLPVASVYFAPPFPEQVVKAFRGAPVSTTVPRRRKTSRAITSGSRCPYRERHAHRLTRTITTARKLAEAAFGKIANFFMPHPAGPTPRRCRRRLPWDGLDAWRAHARPVAVSREPRPGLVKSTHPRVGIWRAREP